MTYKLNIYKLKNTRTNLRNLKSKVDKLDVNKLVSVRVDLSKLSDVVKNDVVKKDVFNGKIKNIEDKIPDITNLATNTNLNVKINEIKNEIPSTTNLATTAALTTVENKISNVSDLVRKADYDAKISEMENQYFTTSDYNKFTNNTLDSKITQKKLINEYDLNEKIKKISNKRKIKTLATKAELKAEQDKIIKLQTYDLRLFIGQSYFNNDGAQIYLIFQPIYKTITTFSGLIDTISEQESKGLPNKKFMSPFIANVSLCPKLIWMNNLKITLTFKGRCLKQEDKAKNVVNLFIVYELIHSHEI